MSTYARLDAGNVVVEIIVVASGSKISSMFHPDFVATCRPCGDDVRQGWTWDNASFVPPSEPVVRLDDLKATQIAALTAACAAAIVGGYRSSSLGTEHKYPSGVTDQINMMGSVTASLLPGLPEGWTTPFWCCDEAGTWAFRDHSQQQIQAAGSDGKAHIVSCQATLAQISIGVVTATTQAEVNAISWPSAGA